MNYIPLSPGHRACAGCGQMIAARAVAESFGPNVIVANATGCLEVTTTAYPESSWGMPWIHSLFENAPAVASGILAAVKYRDAMNRVSTENKKIKVVAQGGDGSTFDIGFGLLSGMWERGDDILYICYDNEAYANTGMQASGATPWAANTSTTPSGKCLSASPLLTRRGVGGEENSSEKTEKDKNSNHQSCSIDAIGSHQRKKDMIAIALAHGVKYVAQTTAGFPTDIANKIKKALAMPGPAYIQILCPCTPGWKIETNLAVKLGKLAVQTGLYPTIEYIDGVLTQALKVPKPSPRVEEYLKLQGRFSHLFKNETGAEQIKNIQKIADANIEKYGL
jgi:pyruvate ferredoxin oxidoreductase beta subunit